MPALSFGIWGLFMKQILPWQGQSWSTSFQTMAELVVGQIDETYSIERLDVTCLVNEGCIPK